jgi:hypothetical protein
MERKPRWDRISLHAKLLCFLFHRDRIRLHAKCNIFSTN